MKATASRRTKFSSADRMSANPQVWRVFRILKFLGGFRRKATNGSGFGKRAAARIGSGASPPAETAERWLINVQSAVRFVYALNRK